jgi:hypothetical protein
MQPAPRAPRTPATGHDTYRTGTRRSTKPSAHCENRPSHQTQYPRFHELAHALLRAEPEEDDEHFAPPGPQTSCRRIGSSGSELAQDSTGLASPVATIHDDDGCGSARIGSQGFPPMCGRCRGSSVDRSEQEMDHG